jgi:hypothetical protein
MPSLIVHKRCSCRLQHKHDRRIANRKYAKKNIEGTDKPFFKAM